MLNWLKECDLMLLKEEHRQLIAIVGIDNYIELLSTFDKTQVYFSIDALSELKRDYIIKHRDKQPAELAKILRCNISYVYRILKDSYHHKKEVQGDLFSDTSDL